ncbi:MAG: hypothetical protein LAN62_05595 [Acidobacteriia bacterium]|nr:hypothetical protein [Terriglobia bacterium]
MADAKNDRNVSHSMFGLNDPSAGAGQGPAPAPTQPVYAPAPPSSPWSFSGGQILFLLVIVLLVLTGVNLYLVISSRRQFNDYAAKMADQTNLITRRLDSSDERYAQLRGQFQVTSEKLGLTQDELARARQLAANVQKQQQATVAQLNNAIAKKASAEEMNKLQTEANAKFGNLSGDLAGTKADLEATKQALTGAKGELGGAIARTHDELVALAHRTDRDYFEFNLAKKNVRQKVGTVMIELTKTNLKKNQFTVNLYFDDKRTERKDKAINEPVYFYVQGAPSALELVVNKVGKESIAGYVSTPKGFFAGIPSVLSARPGA